MHRFIRGFILQGGILLSLILSPFGATWATAIEIRLEWSFENPQEVSGIKIFHRQEDQPYNYDMPLYQGSDSSLVIEDFNPEASHFFVARAFDDQGHESADSNEAAYHPTSPPGQNSAYVVCENGEDETVDAWEIVDNFPYLASVQNVHDEERQSRVIQLVGLGINHSFGLTRGMDTFAPANGQFVLAWHMKVNDYFFISLSVETTDGERILYYTPSDEHLLGSDRFIHHGFGSSITDDQWHWYLIDLVSDLQQAQPNLDLLKINAFFIRGSGLLDDLLLTDSPDFLPVF
jgi:hypothetical protein